MRTKYKRAILALAIASMPSLANGQELSEAKRASVAQYTQQGCMSAPSMVHYPEANVLAFCSCIGRAIAKHITAADLLKVDPIGDPEGEAKFRPLSDACSKELGRCRQP
jgi:hypothetical protein